MYNGKENQDELGLGWLDYGARMYQPEIGRFHQIDAFSSNYLNLSPYGYVGNNPVNSIDFNGDFILPKEFIQKFQKLAHYLRYGIQGVLKNRRIVNALKEHGGFSDSQLDKVFAWNSGPVVKPTKMEVMYDSEGNPIEVLGDYDPKTKTLHVNIDLFDRLEKAKGREREYALFILAVTIMHEAVHYGYDINGLTTGEDQVAFEEGNNFEKAAYGEVIKTSNGSHRKVMDNWLKNQSQKSGSSSSSGGFWNYWIANGTGGSVSGTSGKKKKKSVDADKKASDRSGGG